jgi:hypothetical protein
VQLVHRQHVPVDPEDVRYGNELRARPDLGQDRFERLPGGPVPNFGDPNPRSRHVQRAEQAEVLGVGRDDFVVRAEPQPGEDDPAALRG